MIRGRVGLMRRRQRDAFKLCHGVEVAVCLHRVERSYHARLRQGDEAQGGVESVAVHGLLALKGSTPDLIIRGEKKVVPRRRRRGGHHERGEERPEAVVRKQSVA